MKLTLAEKTDEHALFENGSVSYRVKSLSSNGALKVILTARKEDSQHVDHLDLYGSKARKMFAGIAAARLAVEPEKIEGDLLELVGHLERLQSETASEAHPHRPCR